MTETELLEILARGEDSRHQFKRDETNADSVPVAGSSPADIDEKAFTAYFQRRFGQRPEYAGQGLEQLLQNLGLSDGRELNLAGLLLFGQRPQRLRPALVVKAVCFPGTALTDTRYLDSEDIDGTLPEQYQRSFAFIRRNLRHVQGDRGFNTLGQLEIPEQALEELLVNALIHRDYFTSASIRLMVFADRVEILSPGHLPDSLSTEAIRRGATNRRNPTLTEHAVHLLPYRGLGTGIPRALHDWPAIELIDDVAANQFRVVVRRPAAGEGAQQVTGVLTPQVTPQVTQQVTPQVSALVQAFRGEHARQELMAVLGLRDRNHFTQAFLLPAIDSGLIEMTLPDKPNSRLQRYRLTLAGRALQQAAERLGGTSQQD